MHTPDTWLRPRFALVTWGHFLNGCYGSFFAPILPLLAVVLPSKATHIPTAPRYSVHP
jgi:hypothetical protein